MSTSGSWVCAECGKVCKSQGGLTQHSAVHKHHPRLKDFDNNTTRLYHPNLDGGFNFSFCPTSSDLPKGNHVDQMESSFPLAPHSPLRCRNLMMIGLPLHHAPASNSQKFCTAKPLSQMKPLMNFSVSGLLHWFCMMPLHRYLIITTSTQQLTLSNLAMYPGNHTPPSIMVSTQKMHGYPSG